MVSAFSPRKAGGFRHRFKSDGNAFTFRYATNGSAAQDTWIPPQAVRRQSTCFWLGCSNAPIHSFGFRRLPSSRATRPPKSRCPCSAVKWPLQSERALFRQRRRTRKSLGTLWFTPTYLSISVELACRLRFGLKEIMRMHFSRDLYRRPRHEDCTLWSLHLCGPSSALPPPKVSSLRTFDSLAWAGRVGADVSTVVFPAINDASGRRARLHACPSAESYPRHGPVWTSRWLARAMPAVLVVEVLPAGGAEPEGRKLCTAAFVSSPGAARQPRQTARMNMAKLLDVCQPAGVGDPLGSKQCARLIGAALRANVLEVPSC